MTLTHRERVQLAQEHRETDRTPVAMVCAGINAPARTALEDYLQRTRGIGVDAYLRPIIDLHPVAPRYIGPALPEGMDFWGVHRSPVSYGADCYTEIDHYPLAAITDISQLDSLSWPSTAWFDYASIPAQIAALRAEDDYAFMASGWGNIFETAWYMRGFEQLFTDLLDNPELADGIMSRVTTFYVEHYRRILEQAPGDFALAFTADDIGGQDGLLLSPALWETHLKPHHVRLNRAIHEYGVRVIYHSDGAVMDAVPGLIEMGIDVLQALQFDAAGMDPARLKADHGDALSFEGGVSVQHTLPFGTPDDVRREVRHLIATLGRGGGYILGPAHVIQAGTPPENIAAMFDTAIE